LKSHHVDGDADEHQKADKESREEPNPDALPVLVQQNLTHRVLQELLLVGGDKAREQVRPKVTRRLLQSGKVDCELPALVRVLHLDARVQHWVDGVEHARHFAGDERQSSQTLVGGRRQRRATPDQHSGRLRAFAKGGHVQWRLVRLLQADLCVRAF